MDEPSPAGALVLVLPLPPSINHQYATVQGRRVLSRAGREFKRFVAEEVEPPRPPAELAVEERFVVGLPRELGDVEVARDTEVPAKAA